MRILVDSFVGKDKNGQNVGYVDATSPNVAYTWSQIDYLYWNNLIPDKNTGRLNYESASGYNLARANTGYIGNYALL